MPNPQPELEEVLRKAKRKALEHARSIESNVVQDRIVRESVDIALAWVAPFIVVPQPEPEVEGWVAKTWRRLNEWLGLQ